MRVFRHFVWLGVGSVKIALPHPTHHRVTHTVGRISIREVLLNSIANKEEGMAKAFHNIERVNESRTFINLGFTDYLAARYF